jgi:predicted N-acetyltransferase YhbS
MITVRYYNHDSDYERVSQFLVRTYSTAGVHINWLQPRWEYMHYHPLIKGVNLNAIGIWEDEGEIAGVVHPEHETGFAYFEVNPVHAVLKRDMLTYAEEHLSFAKNDNKALRIYINDWDAEFQDVAAGMGYMKHSGFEVMSRFVISDTLPVISLPDGFQLKSLAEDNDMRKINRVLWRGFDHGDEPEDGIEDRKFMQSAPNFKHELNIVVEALDGSFVSYCGMWYEPVHRVAYVEPVATDPDYRRMGLGRATVLEGIRRCSKLGATVNYVGSNMPIYLSMGFTQFYRCSVWRREWSK